MFNFSLQISVLLLLFLSATIFNISICSTNKVVRCNENDRKVLLIFKQGVEDPYNRLSSWSNEEDCCAWAGVQCDNITSRVTQLDLHNDNNTLQPESLGGEISLSLLQLEFLHYLDLSHNEFETISIPQLMNFSNLHYLDLSHNSFGMLKLDWLSRISSLEYLSLSGVDLGNETNWLQFMAMLPSISELHLSFCGLRSISPTLTYVNFTSLVKLDLSYNDFKSKLPNWLFNLTSDISYLDLSCNNLQGQIPMALLRLQNLKSLMLNHNQLNGSIPNWFGQHENLQYFDISFNLFYGPIPSSLGNLSSLILLDLSHNQLSRNLPKNLGQLFNLKRLGVRDNSLVGVLSEANFVKFSNLEYLDLSNSSFEFDFDSNWVPPFQLLQIRVRKTRLGPNFPAWLYTQKSLDFLDVSHSGISSVDEMFWSFLEGVKYVDLSYNLIRGDLSKIKLNTSSIRLDHNNFIGGLPRISANVHYLFASSNSFSGSIFPLLCQPVSSEENMLKYLDISHNHLTGALPDCWANWEGLNILNMGSNKLTGEVPPSMGLLSHLQILDLRDNSFFGEFSQDLSNWKILQFLNLDRNNFSGSLPNTMQQDLVVMKMRSNQFTGSIPPQICNLASLIVLDLGDNNISGFIPRCVYNLTGMISGPSISGIVQEITNLFTKGQELEYRKTWLLRSIDLSTNNLVGEIPQELFSLIQLQSLNLSQNYLTGQIPKKIGGMKSLESLDLSRNKLFGHIPQTISDLSFLSYLDLSYNSFTGEIPIGTQLQSFEAWSFIGNLELCGAPLPKKCNKHEENDNLKLAKGNEDDNFLKSLYLGMGVGFAVGFWGVCGSLFLNKAWRHRFFRLFDGLVDQLYVAMVLKFKSFR